MTSTATATLIAPRADGRLSGGFLVNGAWLESPFLCAEEATTVVELERVLSESDGGLALVDSLYLSDAQSASIITRAARTIPIALLAHSLPSLIPGLPVRERRQMLELERAFLSEARGAIAPSLFMADALARRGLAREAVEIVRPAPIVDARALDRSSSSAAPRTGSPRILTVANWTPAKGIDHAVRALTTVETDWRWTLVGSEVSHPDYARGVRDLIDATGLTDRMQIVPPRPPAALGDYYATADIFLLPSLMESYGLVFSEAMSFGLPVIAYRCAAVAEVVGQAGGLSLEGSTLVDAGDIRGLSEAIRSALESIDRDLSESPHRSNRPDRNAASTLPDPVTSRRDLETALRSLALKPTRDEVRR